MFLQLLVGILLFGHLLMVHGFASETVDHTHEGTPKPLTDDESIFRKISSLLGNEASFQGCSIQLNHEYWYMNIVDAKSNEAKISLSGGQSGGRFDYIRLHSFFSGNTTLKHTQELRYQEGQVELSVVRFRHRSAPQRICLSIFGSCTKTIGFIKRKVHMTISYDGTVQNLQLHDYYHRTVLGRYPQAAVKEPINCESQ